MADAIPAAEGQVAALEKKSLKWPVIIAAVTVAIVAGGGGVYLAMSGEKTGAGSKAEAQEEAPKGPALYVKFDPPFVVNFEAKGLMRFLQVSVEVMTRDTVTSDLLKQHDPRLRNDLLLLLGNQTYETISTRAGKEQLRKEALETVAKVIASEGGDPKRVEQIYFTSFVMQ